MAIVNAVASGNYSNFAVTFGGVIPVPGDTVRISTPGIIVYLDTPVSGITFENNTQTGVFQIRQEEVDANSGTLDLSTCDIKSIFPNGTALSCSHNSGTVSVRDVEVYAPNGDTFGLRLNGGGVVNVRDARAMTTLANAKVVRLSGAGTLNVVNAFGGGGVNSFACENTGSGTLNIQNAYHGVGTNAHGGLLSSGGTLNVTNAYGGYITAANSPAVANYSTGTVYVENAYAGNLSAGPAVSNTGTGYVYVENAYGNDYGPGGIGFTSVALAGTTVAAAARTFVKRLFCGRYGALPTSGTVFLQPASDNVFQFRESPDGPTKTLVDASIAGDSPDPSDVRALVVYDNGDSVGTCAVPLAAQTSFNVPVDDTVGTAVLTVEQLIGTLQPNPASAAERSIEDEKPLTFSWPNSTDTITGEVSIDNGAYVPVAGVIAYFREEDGKHYFTLAFDAADRPTEEGTARYKFSSGSYTMYATLRTVADNPVASGDYTITRVFQVTGGGTVAGVRMSLVGVDGTTTTTGLDGEAVISADAGTYTLRVVVPVGYEAVADTTVTITGADDADVVTLTPRTSIELIPSSDQLMPTILSVVDQFGIAVPAGNVTASVQGFAVFSGDNLVVNTTQQKPLNASGIVVLQLYRGMTYRIVVRVRQDVIVDMLHTIPTSGDEYIIRTTAS